MDVIERVLTLMILGFFIVAALIVMVMVHERRDDRRRVAANRTLARRSVQFAPDRPAGRRDEQP
jgi:hypothetical protein